MEEWLSGLIFLTFDRRVCQARDWRTAEAAGAGGIITDGTTADASSPKAIRSTMGSCFRVPLVREEDFYSMLDEALGRGWTIVGTAPEGSVSYEDADYPKKCAIMIGNEGRGLTDGALQRAALKVRIPMEGKVESLNASIAAAVLMNKIKERGLGR